MRTELAELANFYQERNKARVASHYLSLFPISYEHDVEADLSLPQVLPPYLPPKAKDAKPYTLVLDLDETLIHFEEVIYSHKPFRMMTTRMKLRVMCSTL